MLLNNLTVAGNRGYANRTVPHWIGGFDRSQSSGAEVMRRKVHGFFYASRFMVGGVLGSREARRTLSPVCQPDTSSTAQKFDSSGRWFKTIAQESIMNTQVAPSALTISNISVRQDDQSRYSLNDLHAASGGELKYRPQYWLANQQTKDLITELEKENEILKAGIPAFKTTKGRHGGGTYVIKELAISYAMWISASFSLKVIRAYDAAQAPTGTSQNLHQSIIEKNQYIDKLLTVNKDLYEKIYKLGIELERPQIKNFQTKILVTIENGETRQILVPFDCVIVNPNNELSLRTVIRECVPPELLPVIIDQANQLMLHKFKLRAAHGL